MNLLKPILIRADAGGVIGTGHVMRMIALAQAYQKRGGKAIVATVTCPNALIDRVRENGITHVPLEAKVHGSDDDATEALELARREGVEWIITDGYHFSHEYQKRLKEEDVLLLCVDDHGYSSRWCCDAILNQNLNAEKWAKYSCDSAQPQLLLGSRFCLLREEFVGLEPKQESAVPLQNVLVSLGGSDPDNATLQVIELLNRSVAVPLDIRIVVGADNQNRDSLNGVVSHHNLTVVSNIERMSEQYLWADGVITAGGSTCWEWLSLGLPGAIVTIAENQVPICRALSERKVALSLGWFHEFSEKEVKALGCWIAEPSLSLKGQEGERVVDGKGGDRVASLLSPSLKITIICSAESWLIPSLEVWIESLRKRGLSVVLLSDPSEISEGDLLFILSYWGLIESKILRKNTHNLVVHESALPQGKGWSPMTWQVLQGSTQIPVTLFEALEKVDSGRIYLQEMMQLDGTELVAELREKQAIQTISVCEQFVELYPAVVGEGAIQEGKESFYKRRGPRHSRLDLDRTIREQFNLLRVVDNEDYPAFFELHGRRYEMRITRSEQE